MFRDLWFPRGQHAQTRPPQSGCRQICSKQTGAVQIGTSQIRASQHCQIEDAVRKGGTIEDRAP